MWLKKEMKKMRQDDWMMIETEDYKQLNCSFPAIVLSTHSQFT